VQAGDAGAGVGQPLSGGSELALRLGADLALDNASAGEFDLAIEASGTASASRRRSTRWPSRVR
jgi:hypothetical protein